MEDEEGVLDHLPITGYDYTVGSLTEEEYRQWIDHIFRAIFEPYEQIGGIPCRELLNRFQYRGYGLPQDRRKDLMLYLDANRDGRITYQGFHSALVHKRYVDLPPYQRFAMCLLLAANPGVRLSAARTRAIKHLQAVDVAGRSGVVVPSDRLPNAITGYAGNCEGGADGGGGVFRLEPDGVWPTLRPRREQKDQTEATLTIMEEEYIPELYLETFKCRPPPIFCPLMILVQLAVFTYYAVELTRRVVAEPDNTLTWSTGLPYFSPLHFDPRQRREVWRFFTYMLINQGYWPVIFNSMMTLLLGSLMEWAQATWKIILLYIAGVFAGSLATSVWDPKAIGVGASGGVYALVGAHLTLSVINWEEMKHDYFAMKRSSTGAERAIAIAFSGITRVCLLLLLCGLDFGIGLYFRFGFPDAPLHPSFSPMPAGLIAGVLVGVALLYDLRQNPWERVSFWVCFGVSLALLFFAIFWNIFWPGYPPEKV